MIDEMMPPDEERELVHVAVGPTTATLVLGDAIEGMRQLPDASFDLAIVDPPYGASTRGTWQLPEDHGLDGFGGAWSIASHEWDMLSGLESFQLTMAYLTELKRLVRPTGSFFVHSTYHNSGIVNVACQLLGIEILNEIIWYKRNAFPNLANRRLTASHETIHWAHTGPAKKRQYRFNSVEVKASSFANDSLKTAGKQMRTVWDIPNNKDRSELSFGKHPAQKPIAVASRLLMIAGAPEGQILVPFSGSGSEMIAASRYGMHATGFEIDRAFFNLTLRRLRAEDAAGREQGL